MKRGALANDVIQIGFTSTLRTVCVDTLEHMLQVFFFIHENKEVESTSEVFVFLSRKCLS